MVGSIVEFAIKAYGAGAAASVAISDAETLRGKADDALAAVPNLSEEYRDAQYVVEHREEIRSAIDYLNEHTPAQSEFEQAADEGSETLRGIETTYSEVLQAKDAVDAHDAATLGKATAKDAGRGKAVGQVAPEGKCMARIQITAVLIPQRPQRVVGGALNLIGDRRRAAAMKHDGELRLEHADALRLRRGGRPSRVPAVHRRPKKHPSDPQYG